MAVTESCYKRKYFRFCDLIPFAIVLVAAVFSVWALAAPSYNDGQLVAVITVNSEEYCRVNLSDVEAPYDLSVPAEDGEVVIHITGDGIFIKSSPCPDKLCVNTGKLTKAGQAAVCLPQRVSVKLVSAAGTLTPNQPDVVVG